ncbi:hypothetical protein B0T20DRAFT_390471 [Sordaria brevicollis]|uniref:Uncharacterized protein n=1 Tax=Sordaria brevicollis TaxID=83679 RepID=A0AAE0PIM8_SORBR|nr:hypothetical protein B0T20DRAFT_390471 [Sordaria brevicollis]
MPLLAGTQALGSGRRGHLRAGDHPHIDRVNAGGDSSLSVLSLSGALRPLISGGLLAGMAGSAEEGRGSHLAREKCRPMSAGVQHFKAAACWWHKGYIPPDIKIVDNDDEDEDGSEDGDEDDDEDDNEMGWCLDAGVRIAGQPVHMHIVRCTTGSDQLVWNSLRRL